MKLIDAAVSKGDMYGFSNTHAGESIGLAAALKTLQIYKEEVIPIY